jgi:predicted adenylyl cyclase CyaB
MLEVCLRDSIGYKGIVDKTRHLFLHKQTRVHLDDVKDLGYFLEFEVVLKPEDSIEFGQEIAEEMMEIFGVRKDRLLEGAYLDQLLK